MIRNIKDIRKFRLNLDLTQKELAVAAGVSQSLIAKIESGDLDPSYTNAQRIIETLENYRSKTQIFAKNLMSKDIYFIKPTTSTKKIVQLFREEDISQSPVCEKGIVIGLVTERDLINSISSKGVVATDIMQASPPFVSSDTPLEPIKSLLMHFSCVLVVDKGKPAGIITKADLISCNEL